MSPPIERSEAAQFRQWLIEEEEPNWGRTDAGLKYDEAKPRTDLISSVAMEEIGKVLAYGAVKYGPNNWRKGIAWGRLIGAVLRHVFAWMRGEDLDPESGLPHLSHALTTLMMLVEFQQTRRDLDDRWPKEEKA